MTPDEFRQRGYQVIDWIAKYMEDVERYPVLSQVVPGEIRGKLPAAPPEHGESFDALLRDMHDIILPGVTHWQSPNFFAFFPSNNSGPSILGDLLSSGLGVQGMLWATSPACTELETHVLDWLVGMLGLPAQFHSSSLGGGVIQDAASSASLCALLAARERRTQYATNARGVCDRMTAYASTQAHSSIEKAMMVAGMGRENLRMIDVDESFAMRPDRLEEAIVEDQRSGAQPFCVVASVGTTSSGAVDPLPAIGEICRRHGLWFHVDAAAYGTAGLCPEFRGLFQGLERADSFCFNPHKWMFVNFDCDCFYVADRAALIRTLSVLPEYLKNKATTSGAVIDYRDWQVPLGRRFRALKLWFVIRHYGVEGLRAKVREHVALAQQFARWVDEHPSFERVAPAPLNLVTFRHVAGNAANQQILDRINQSGLAYLTHTKLGDRLVIRMSIGQTNTKLEHVQNAWALLCRAADQLQLG
ncbi:MAG: pyridoxal phosphate-dependent decarboxylase family protein [Pirellulaceae bacterium]